MTREETVKIIRIMCDSYPNYKPNNLSETVDVWCSILEEYEYNDIAMALKVYILSDTSGFAPSIGQIVDKLHSITAPKKMSGLEAWGYVQKAICNSTWHSEEEFAMLPPDVQRAVGSAGQLKVWATTENLNHEVTSSNFIRSYETVLKRKKELDKLPSYVKKILEEKEKEYVASIEQKKVKAIDSEEEKEKRQIPERVKEKMNQFMRR